MTVAVVPKKQPVVVVEKLSDYVWQVRLNRPDAHNALNLETRRALAEAFDELAKKPDVRAVVLSGDGKNFAAGADLSEFKDATSTDIYLRGLNFLWRSIAQFPKPIIAAVEGYALGGGLELAMHCDVIVASKDAKLGQTEVKVGLMPGAGGTQRLLRLVGRQKAMSMLLTGGIVSGTEAERLGLVAEVTEPGETFDRATEMAKKIAAMPPLAIEQIKEVVTLGEDAPLETALGVERKAFQLLFGSQDLTEGLSAFKDKRQPEYGRR